MGTEKMDEEISMYPSLLLPEKVVKLSQSLSEGLNAIRDNLQEILDDIYDKTRNKSEENGSKNGMGKTKENRIPLKPSIFVFDGNTRRIVFALAPEKGATKQEKRFFEAMKMGYLGVRYPHFPSRTDKALDLFAYALSKKREGKTILAIAPRGKYKKSPHNEYFLQKIFNKAYVKEQDGKKTRPKKVAPEGEGPFVIEFPSTIFETAESNKNEIENRLEMISGVAIMARKYQLPGIHPPIICAAIGTITDTRLKDPKDKDYNLELMDEGGLFYTLIEQIDYYGQFLQIAGYQLANYAFASAKGDHLERLVLNELITLYSEIKGPISEIPKQFHNYDPLTAKLIWSSIEAHKIDFKGIISNLKKNGRFSEIELISCKKIPDEIAKDFVNEGFSKYDSTADFPAAWFGDLLDKIQNKKMAVEIFLEKSKYILSNQNYIESENYPKLLRDLWQSGMMLGYKYLRDMTKRDKESLWKRLELILFKQSDKDMIVEMLELASLTVNITDPLIVEKVLAAEEKLYDVNGMNSKLSELFGKISRNSQRELLVAKKPPMHTPIMGAFCIPIVVTSQKGGVGKTTVSANLARILSRKCDGKVLLVELDICGPTYGFWHDIGDNSYSTTQSFFQIVGETANEDGIALRHWRPKRGSETGFYLLTASTKRREQSEYKYIIGDIVENIYNFIEKDPTFLKKYRFMVMDCPAEYINSVLESVQKARKRGGFIINVADPTPHTIIPAIEASTSLFVDIQQYLLVNKVRDLDFQLLRNKECLSHFLASTKIGLGSFRTKMAALIRLINRYKSNSIFISHHPGLGGIKSMEEMTDERNLRLPMDCPSPEQAGLEAVAKDIMKGLTHEDS